MNEANLRVDLVGSDGRSQTIYKVDHELFLNFAYAYWSPDENIAALLVCGTDVFRFAYDQKQAKMIPFETIEDDVKKKLEEDYLLPKDHPAIRIDPPHSPCMVEGWMDEFRRRYPHGVSDSGR